MKGGHSLSPTGLRGRGDGQPFTSWAISAAALPPAGTDVQMGTVRALGLIQPTDVPPIITDCCKNGANSEKRQRFHIKKFRFLAFLEKSAKLGLHLWGWDWAPARCGLPVAGELAPSAGSPCPQSPSASWRWGFANPALMSHGWGHAPWGKWGWISLYVSFSVQQCFLLESIQAYSKKLQSRRRAIISHLLRQVKRLWPKWPPRPHSKLVSEAGQEPRAPTSHPRASSVAFHRPAPRLDLAESERARLHVGTAQPPLLRHHLLSEAPGLARVWVAQGPLSFRGSRPNNNDSHSFIHSSLIPTGSAGQRRRAQLWTVALVPSVCVTLGKLSVPLSLHFLTC